MTSSHATPALPLVPEIRARGATAAWSPVDHARSLPAAPALQIVRLAKRWNVGAEQLLGPLGLREEQLARISIETKRALISRASELTGEAGLGFYLGLEMRATNYGYLGFAVMSAGTLWEALGLTIRFLPALTGAFELRLKVEGKVASLALDTHVDFGSIEDVFILGAVVGLWQIGERVHRDGAARSDRVDVSRAALRVPLRASTAGGPLWPVRHTADFRRIHPRLPDRERGSRGAAAGTRSVHAALDSLDCSSSGLAERVRRLVASSSDAPASLAEAAATLRVSPRTLKRKLAAQGVSFSQLLADARQQTALQLLQRSSLSVSAIAKRLGYSTAPNFIRAFRRWTGETPINYRRAAT